MLNVFLGYDEREYEAYRVAAHSMTRHSRHALAITPLTLSLAKTVANRPISRKENKLWCPVSKAPMATEFACSRFAVPLLQKEGWALFADCDVLCQADLSELFSLADSQYAVMVAKHQYEATAGRKMDGQWQTTYSRKNWSSVILWNCSHPSNRRMSKELLETWPGRFLHAFRWLDDSEIGDLPLEWNWLVDVYPDNPEAKLLHYTLGGPWFEDYKDCGQADVWLAEHARCLN